MKLRTGGVGSAGGPKRLGQKSISYYGEKGKGYRECWKLSRKDKKDIKREKGPVEMWAEGAQEGLVSQVQKVLLIRAERRG